jgi:hypothetical protein
MGTSPDQIAAEISDTRAELAADVDRLADHARPSSVVRRRVDRVRGAVSGARDKVMGSAATDAAGQAAEATKQTAGQVAEAVKSAPDQAIRHTQGNPIAAGLIAFGAGLLTASLLPRSQAEQRAGLQIRQQGAELVEPVKEAVTESGQHITEDLKTRAQQAAGEVKDTAKQAAQEIGQQARESGSEGARI